MISTLYVNHYPMVKKYILSNQGSEEIAKDMFQESLMAFIFQVEKGKFLGHSSIKTYLFAIARNFWLAEIRKIKKNKVVLDNIGEYKNEPDDTIEDLLSKRNSTQQMEILFEKLKFGCQEILRYFYHEEMTLSEIRQKLNLGSDQAVSNKKYRCLKSLADLFKTARISKGAL